MTDIAVKPIASSPTQSLVKLLMIVLMTGVVLIVGMLANRFRTLTIDNALLLDSTVGELAIWMSEQTEEAEIESYLGQYAENWAQSLGQESLAPEVLLHAMRNGLVVWTGVIALVATIGLLNVFVRAAWVRPTLLITLLGLDALLFIIPATTGDNSLTLLLTALIMVLIALLLAPGRVSRVIGFFAALSILFVVWEAGKAFAASVDYRVTLSQPNWQYTTYATLEDSLDALERGDVSAVVFDRRDLSEHMAAQTVPESEAVALRYPNLRYLDELTLSAGVAFMPIAPEFPGRLSIAVRAEDAERWSSVGDFSNVLIATVTGEFADTQYLAQPRQLVLLDLKILNDLNLPHLQTIAEAMMQPARRNGTQLLVRILADAALYTWGEAFFGFVIGAALGFVLGTLFAHSALMGRSLLPYVVASQTVPILAIAPMVVIWLGASQTSVSVIAAYLTFFPVTINTLRGLQSPKPTAVELMESYAASRWTILWKLRVPAALPYIFTALKVSATASVVGAIIGELPSGISSGLGRTIIHFSSDYSLVSTPKLWAAIFMAASVGIIFFVSVGIIESIVLGRYIRGA